MTVLIIDKEGAERYLTVDFGTGGKQMRSGRYTKKMEEQQGEHSFTPNKKCTVEDICVLKELVWNEVSGADYNLF